MNMLPVLSFVLGLVTGSFLNAVAFRLKIGKSFVQGRSICPHCKHELKALDLLPVLSFVFLQGRCRYCRKKISWQYPIVELLTALVFLLFGLHAEVFSLSLFLSWVLAAIFILVGVYDLKHYLILDKVVFPGLAVALLYAIIVSPPHSLISGVIGMVLVSGFFYFQHLISQGKWIGFGDVKFGLMLGMTAGFPLSLFLLFMAYMSGAVTGIILIATGKKDMGSKLPFGVFLSFAAIITLLYGQRVMDWYLGLIGW